MTLLALRGDEPETSTLEQRIGGVQDFDQVTSPQTDGVEWEVHVERPDQ